MKGKRRRPARGRTHCALARTMSHSAPPALYDGEGAAMLRRISFELADRLQLRGVRLTSRESPEALTDLLEAVEHFEVEVESRGGNRTLRQLFNGRAPVDPDHPEFVLPARADDEPVAKFTARVIEATTHLRPHLALV